MKKLLRILLCVLVVALPQACSQKENPVPDTEAPVFSPDAGDSKAFSEKTLPVLRRGTSAGSVKVRYYEDLPSIPYISVADFQALMLPGSTMSVSWKEGVYELTNSYGTATVNTAEERFFSQDYMAFTNLMDQVQKGMDNAYLDGAPFVRYARQEVSAPEPVEFLFGGYGIDLRGDGSAVYFPFPTLADMYADLYYHYAVCNGEKVIVADRDEGANSIETQDPAFSSENLLAGPARAQDLIAYSYGELCFVIDHFYGMPGRSPFEGSIGSVGLNKTLEASAAGNQVKRLLQSSNRIEMAAGMDFLIIFLYDGGHSKTWLGAPVVPNDQYSFQADYPDLLTLYMQMYLKDEIVKVASYTQILYPLRASIFPDGATYHKKGDTAICRIDDFHTVDYPAWRAYYAGTGPMPTLEQTTDMMTIFLDALKKADEDPEVKNLVFDLTFNTGGSLDLVVAMTSLLYGESLTRSVNPLTGQRVLWCYDVDRNFDGKFDEKDKEVHYDLNFCILTSHFCFSCGNMFPSLCKDAGVLIAGETCGGGSCAVGVYRTPEGFQYQISSARSRLSDKNWENIDSGVTPNIPIELGENLFTTWNGVTVGMASVAKFYDLDYLSGIINAYYQ